MSTTDGTEPPDIAVLGLKETAEGKGKAAKRIRKRARILAEFHALQQEKAELLQEIALRQTIYCGGSPDLLDDATFDS